MAVTPSPRGSALAARAAGTVGKPSPLSSPAYSAPKIVDPDPNPPQVNPDAGSPEWWLRHLVNQLLVRQREYRIRDDYFMGNHPVPKGDYRYMKALGHLQELAATNYIGMITSTPVERMEVRGFRFGDPGTSDDDAAAIWQNSDMDLQSHTIHMNAAKYGLGYALVKPPGPDDQYPTIISKDPRTSIVYPDPAKPTKALAGLCMWESEVVGRVLAVLYLPEGAYGFVGPYIYETDGLNLQDLNDLLLYHIAGGNSFKLSGFVANPPDVQEVALTEYTWRPNTGVWPQAECGADIRRVQDRINQTIFQRMCISHFQAYKQRWATGIATTNASGKKGKAPFDPGFDTLWGVSSENVKFGEFTSADITQILEAIRDDVAAIATLTKTPAHYLMGAIANVSGETLTQAESGLVSKTRQRMSSMGWAHERVMKLCFAYMGDQRATDPTAAVLWANPGRELIADTALAGLQWTQAGIPLAIVMEGQGNWDQDQIAFSVAEKEKADQLALEQQQQQMEMQQQNAVALAQVGAQAKAGAAGTPGAKPSANPAKKQGALGPKAPAKPKSGATPKSKTPSKPVKPAAK